MFWYIVSIVGGLIVVALVMRFVVMPRLMMKHRPRIQHYVFAHKLLPQTLFSNPVELVLPLVATATDRSKTDGVELLRALWNDSHVEPSEQSIEWDPSNYEVTCLSHPNNMVIVLTLPQPIKRAEAYYVAMVVDSPGMAAGHIRQLRYFVLEHVGTSGEKVKTYLSEWSPKEGSEQLDYTIHFEDVEPSVAVMLQKIEGLLPTKLPV